MHAPIDELARLIRARKVILFAGAGLSMSVGLPSWNELVAHMRRELGLEPEGRASYQTLAEYYRLTRGSIGPLRSWMDRTWSVSEERVKKSRLHELFIGLDFPLIYTTNYDNNLEIAFRLHGKPFVKVANARDVANASDGATQIVKFHGDFEDDASLVITESDYFARMSFDSPLDVKFRADAMSRTLLFIGYSLRDLNIRLLLHRIWESWSRSPYERNRPQSYIFLPRAGPAQRAVLARWGLTVVTSQTKDPEAGLTDFLERLAEQVSRDPEEPAKRRR